MSGVESSRIPHGPYNAKSENIKRLMKKTRGNVTIFKMSLVILFGVQIEKQMIKKGIAARYAENARSSFSPCKGICSSVFKFSSAVFSA
jgi:hypothetical protein